MKDTGRPIVLVAGARPNFMKIAPVLRALRARNGDADLRLVHTGQHYDASMSDVFFRDLDIPPPDAHLGVGPGRHGAQTGHILAAFERYLLEGAHGARGAVVVGDVNSTLAAALAAVKLGVPVAHVEAGLRSFDRSMPEEVNRVVTDAVAELLLVSEPSGEENLRREGARPERIRFVGNVMIDSVVHGLPSARGLEMTSRLDLAGGPFAFVTIHRPANVDAREALDGIVAFLERLARRLVVVFPVHPRTRSRLEEFGLVGRLSAVRGLRHVEPLGYLETLGLLCEASVVVTDSGGLQEEASFLRVPCLTVRPNTERPVTVTRGTNTVVDSDWPRAEALVEDVLAGRYKRGEDIDGWDGRAAERVADALLETWGH